MVSKITAFTSDNLKTFAYLNLPFSSFSLIRDFFNERANIFQIRQHHLYNNDKTNDKNRDNETGITSRNSSGKAIVCTKS